MINKEKFKKLVDLAYELENLGSDVFIKYYGHVKMIEVKVYLKGWKSTASPDYRNESYFYDEIWGYENETIDDCINSLKGMINTKKEGLDV